MKLLLSLLIALLFVPIPRIAYSGWGWLVYHERSFKGKVIDAETKEPIEGAVIIAQYQIAVLGPTGSHRTLTDVQEALTDKNGLFFVPSLTKFIYPLSAGDDTFFLIWKPGYKKQEVKDSYFFTKEPGTVEQLPVHTDKGFETKDVRLGIVELDKLRTREERAKEIPTRIGDLSDFKKQKHFITLINEERIFLGFKPFDKLD